MSPDRDITGVPVEPTFDPESRLVRAARPVLDDLVEGLSGTPTSIILTDPSARILDRWVGEPGLRHMLDRVGAVPGALFGEEFAGTNGLGTPAEERRGVQVTGPEHFVEALRVFTCVGVPIRHPITGRLEGILDITCRYEDTNALLQPVVLEGARVVEHLLREEASTQERVLLEHFMSATRRSARPIIALNEEVFILNAAARRLLAEADQAVLWERASEALGTREGIVEEVCLRHGVVSMRCRRITAGTRTVGVLIELDRPLRARRRAEPEISPGHHHDLVGHGPAYLRLTTEVCEHAAHRLPLIVAGEPGVGKLAVARAVHHCGTTEGELVVVDAALYAADGPARWFAELRGRLTAASTGTLVVRHLELLDRAAALGLFGLVDTVAAGRLRLIGTFTDEGHVAGSAQALLDRFVARIDVPPLRERVEDIPELVRLFVRRHAPADAGACCAPEVLRALMRCDWPDNVRQLESLVCSLLLRRHRGDISLEDLPAQYRGAAARRPLSRMEQIEHDAIVAALKEAGGNKAAAAGSLGISRATLYRKLRAYTIASDSFAR